MYLHLHLYKLVYLHAFNLKNMLCKGNSPNQCLQFSFEFHNDFFGENIVSRLNGNEPCGLVNVRNLFGIVEGYFSD